MQLVLSGVRLAQLVSDIPNSTAGPSISTLTLLLGGVYPDNGGSPYWMRRVYKFLNSYIYVYRCPYMYMYMYEMPKHKFQCLLLLIGIIMALNQHHLSIRALVRMIGRMLEDDWEDVSGHAPLSFLIFHHILYN